MSERTAIERCIACVRQGGTILAGTRVANEAALELETLHKQVERLQADNRRATPPRAEVDVLREKAKLADEYAACMKELRDEDGDIYGWDDAHSGNTIVGMDIGDVKDWLARYEAISPATTTPDAQR